MKTYTKNLCLVASLSIVVVSLYSIVSIPDAQQAAIEVQEQAEAIVRDSLERALPRETFTDQEIRAALVQARQHIANNPLPQEEQAEYERGTRQRVEREFPGRFFHDIEIREMVLRGLQIQEAIRILTAQRALQNITGAEVRRRLEIELAGQTFTDQEIRDALTQAQSIIANSPEMLPDMEREMAMAHPNQHFTPQEIRDIAIGQLLINTATTIIAERRGPQAVEAPRAQAEAAPEAVAIPDEFQPVVEDPD